MKFILIIFSVATLAFSQWSFKSDLSKSSMKIKGTSTVHDWTSDVEEFAVKGIYKDNAITDLEVSVKVASIKSGKSIMNDKTYDALQKDRHPYIYFKASKLAVSGQYATGTGTITVAGVSKPISIRARLVPEGSTTYSVSGEVRLQMTDFNIEPPTAMFGTMVTGDEVTIQYNVLIKG